MEIFFESSEKKEFASVEERVRFLVKYLGVYVQSYPDLCLIAIQNNKILGYCCGMPQTLPELYELVPHLEVFEDLYEIYPSHLHINCHSSARGMGVGTLLITEFENMMREEGMPGVHIITSPGARNVNFYKKLHYTFEAKRNDKGTDLLFLGKAL